MHSYEFDISWDYANRRNVVLIDTGDGDSIVITRTELVQMLEELNNADTSTS